MQRHKEGGRLPLLEVAREVLCGRLGEELRVIAHACHRHLAVVQIAGHVCAHARLMGEIVQRAPVVAKEVVVPTLERPVVRQGPQVPFADQRRGIAHGLEQGGQRGVRRGQTEVLPGARQRFFQATRQAVLVAPGDQGKAGGRTHGRVGIRLGKAHALGGKAIQVRSVVRRLTVDTEVGPAEVIREEKEHVGWGSVGWTHGCLPSRGVKCECPDSAQTTGSIRSEGRVRLPNREEERQWPSSCAHAPSSSRASFLRKLNRAEPFLNRSWCPNSMICMRFAGSLARCLFSGTRDSPGALS